MKSFKISSQVPKENDHLSLAEPSKPKCLWLPVTVTKAQLACDILQTNVLRVLMSSKEQHGGLDSSTPYGLVEITGFSGTKVKKKIAEN